MSSYRNNPGWIAQLIARTEQIIGMFDKIVDNAGRLRGTPDGTVGVFPGSADSDSYDPAVPADWDTPPTTEDAALDELAERTTDLEAAPPGGGTGDADTYAPYGGTYLRPGPSDSIWYRQVPSDAELVDAALPVADWFAPEHEIIVQTPAETLESIFLNAVGWSGADRSPETTDTGDDAPIPNAFVVNDDDMANYPAALLMADGTTIIESQPFNRESAGSNVTFYNGAFYEKYDMHASQGIFGAHGGSHLPALYGSIRTGEWAPGKSFIPHMIKIVVPPWFLSQNASANDSNPGFRYPASVADTGFDVPADPQEYTGTVDECRMGSILALPKDFDFSVLTTEMARIIARTFQIHGGVICDIRVSDSVAFGMEWSPDHKVYDEMVADFGHDFDDLTFYGEMNIILTNLFVVDNISEDAQGYFHVGGVGGVTDHGALTGLADNDHPQYAIATDLAAHLADAVDAHDASAVSNVPAGTIAATTVQAAINELDGDVVALAAAAAGSDAAHVAAGDPHTGYVLEAATPGGELGGTYATPTVDATHSGSTHSAATDTHIADATDAHAASAVTNTPAGTIAATTVQAAITELDGDLTAHKILGTAHSDSIARGWALGG